MKMANWRTRGAAIRSAAERLRGRAAVLCDELRTKLLTRVPEHARPLQLEREWELSELDSDVGVRERISS